MRKTRPKCGEFLSKLPVLIYITAGFLLAMGAWHIQTLTRTIMLRKQLRKWSRSGREEREELASHEPYTQKSLKTADLDDMVPASVTEHTTRHLTESRKS